MGIKEHKVTVGDTLTPLGVQLIRKNSSNVYAPVNLTGLTVKIQIISRTGTVVVAETTTGVTVIDAAAGKVQYDFSAAAVQNAGTFYCWFTAYSGSEKDTYPVDGRTFIIRVLAAA